MSNVAAKYDFPSLKAVDKTDSEKLKIISFDLGKLCNAVIVK